MGYDMSSDQAEIANTLKIIEMQAQGLITPSEAQQLLVITQEGNIDSLHEFADKKIGIKNADKLRGISDQMDEYLGKGR